MNTLIVWMFPRADGADVALARLQPLAARHLITVGGRSSRRRPAVIEGAPIRVMTVDDHLVARGHPRAARAFTRRG